MRTWRDPCKAMARSRFETKRKASARESELLSQPDQTSPFLGRNMVLAALAVLIFILCITSVLNGGQKNIRTKPPAACDVGWVDIHNSRKQQWAGCGCELHADGFDGDKPYAVDPTMCMMAHMGGPYGDWREAVHRLVVSRWGAMGLPFIPAFATIATQDGMGILSSARFCRLVLYFSIIMFRLYVLYLTFADWQDWYQGLCRVVSLHRKHAIVRQNSTLLAP